MPAKPLGKLKYFEGMKMMNSMMKMNGDMEPMGMEMSNQQMDMNSVMYPEVTGNMNRYVWTIDNKTVSESDKILIKKGENVKIILYNNSMMRHPMHLHGHDFRVLNVQGEYAPLKNVLDIMPMETDTLEFAATESGDIPVTSRLRFNFMGNTDREYMAGFRYAVTKYFSLSTHYDSDMGYGGGITLTY